MIRRPPRSTLFPTRRSSDLEEMAPIGGGGAGAFRVRRRAEERRDSALEDCFGHAAEVGRSEEHTSEVQSRRDLVCRLLLEKKKATLTVLRIASSNELTRSGL